MLGDICNYVEQQERVARYERTTSKPLNDDSKAMLAEILDRQLDSVDE